MPDAIPWTALESVWPWIAVVAAIWAVFAGGRFLLNSAREKSLVAAMPVEFQTSRPASDEAPALLKKFAQFRLRYRSWKIQTTYRVHLEQEMLIFDFRYKEGADNEQTDEYETAVLLPLDRNITTPEPTVDQILERVRKACPEGKDLEFLELTNGWAVMTFKSPIFGRGIPRSVRGWTKRLFELFVYSRDYVDAERFWQLPIVAEQIAKVVRQVG